MPKYIKVRVKNIKVGTWSRGEDGVNNFTFTPYMARLIGKEIEVRKLSNRVYEGGWYYDKKWLDIKPRYNYIKDRKDV